MVIALSIGPAIAIQLCPGGSPYRLPVGPLAPISEMLQVVEKRSLAARARIKAACSVTDFIPAKAESGTSRKAFRAFSVYTTPPATKYAEAPGTPSSAAETSPPVVDSA